MKSKAEKQHDIWSHWMKHMFTKFRPHTIMENATESGTFDTGAFVLPKETYNRWKTQSETDFNNLSEAEQKSDIEIVDMFLSEPFTEEEKEIIDLLVIAHNKFISLNAMNKDHQKKWSDGINLSQSVLMERVLIRDYPKTFVGL